MIPTNQGRNVPANLKNLLIRLLTGDRADMDWQVIGNVRLAAA